MSSRAAYNTPEETGSRAKIFFYSDGILWSSMHIGWELTNIQEPPSLKTLQRYREIPRRLSAASLCSEVMKKTEGSVTFTEADRHATSRSLR